MVLELLDIHMQKTKTSLHILRLTQKGYRSKQKSKAIKLLEENTGETLCDPGLSNDFLDSTQKKHKDFYSLKVSGKKVKKQKHRLKKKCKIDIC